MTERLAPGELERRVMETLWRAELPLTPRVVHDAVRQERDLAYTTVMTTLVRLWTKGQLHRERQGRAFAYRPVVTREEFVGTRMHDVLTAAGDPAAALGHFVEQLDAVERRHLKRLLGRQR